MESLSRPFHSRKLSNATTFSNKTPYDGVFSGHRRKFAGAPPVDLQDYREIFSSSQASSIPVLDLSTFREPSDALSFDFRGLKPDYSKIFGGFRDEDVAVSYEEVFARDKLRVPSSAAPTSQDGDNLSHQSPDALKQFNMSYNKINLKFKDGLDGTKHVTQLPAVTGFTCFVDEPVMEAAKKKPSTVNVSVDVPRKQPSGNVVKKQSNPVESIAEDTTSIKSRTFDVDFKKNASTVSSSPTNDKSRTFDVDFKKYASTVSSSPTNDKSRTFDVDFKNYASTVSSSPTNDKSRTFDVDFKKNASTVSSSPTNDKSRTFDVDFKKNASTVYSSLINAKSRTFDVDFKRNASTVSSSPTNVVNHNNNNPRKSINSESFKTDFNDELDVNSAASASSEALKKAIEKAQESIRIAKESVGRKKKGLRSFSSKKFKNSLKDEGSVEDVTAGEEKKCRDEDSSPLMQDAGRSHKHGGAVLFPSFMDGEKLFVAKKFIDEMHEKISESNKDNKFGDNNATQVTSGPEFKRLDSDGKDEYGTSSSEAVDTETSKNQSSDFAHEYQAENRFRDEYEARIKVSQATNDVLEHQSVVNEQESEKIHDEVRLSNAHEMVEELNNLNVSQEEKDDKEVSQDFNQSDDEKRFDASLELLENKKQENVLEHEDGENAESEKHEEIEQASELVRSENESKHDQNSGFQKAEETTEIFDDFCERDANDSVQTSDNSLEESNLSAETCDNKLEESEVNLHDDCELKHDDRYSDERKEESLDESRDQELKHDDRYSDERKEESLDECRDQELKHDDRYSDERKEESLDESRDQEFDEKSSGGDNVMKETDDMDRIHVASNIVEMNDINVETTQEVDDVTEVSCEYQAEEAEFCEKNFIDQTASDENEDEHILKSEENDIIDNLADLGSENDVQSESSSGSTHGVKIIQEESNTQPPHKDIPDTETTNEIKDSQESVSRQKQDEIEEPGPSKVSGKERFRKIDEEAAAKEREWEKNRLAVERAIREARERAFAEARERAERERAAVEKATEEVRQRMMAEAHEKVSKASATNKSSSERTSTQSKLRAERAAVERATSEARQRALEKAISQKTVSELNRSESALRTKAKLEKHNRIMERAAKALAEKEKRDRLAQKEQAERNRLAENLDADIKRWSNGKEGNLRALLSTLQYILGPESGWQPVSLTEIVTTSAVKKAYRKATLCVHPDKLQQRGATIQQKYICEKVFDLLKAAWNRFNSEER